MGILLLSFFQHLVAFVDTFFSILPRRTVLWFPYYGRYMQWASGLISRIVASISRRCRCSIVSAEQVSEATT